MDTQTLVTELLGPRGLLEAYQILQIQRENCDQPEIVEGIEMAQARVGVAIYTLLKDVDVLVLPNTIKEQLLPIKAEGLGRWIRQATTH